MHRHTFSNDPPSPDHVDALGLSEGKNMDASYFTNGQGNSGYEELVMPVLGQAGPNLSASQKKRGLAGLSPKKKRLAVIGLAVAIVLIAVAVVVDRVVVHAAKRASYANLASTGGLPWTRDLSYPQGYTGTSGNGQFTSSGVSLQYFVGSNYSQIVSIGSSYSATASSRPEQYQSSLPPSTYWQGRWSNGPVWVEYLRDILANKTGNSIALSSWAYGGATTNNSIHTSNVPDTGAQILDYMNSSDYRTSAKILVTAFTSTNDVTMEFTDMATKIDKYADDPQGLLLQPYQAVLRQSANSLVAQLSSMIPDESQPGAIAPDFLILPIIPLDVSLRGSDLVNAAGIDPRKFSQLADKYNEVLVMGAADLAQKLGTRGRVFTYDVPALLHSIEARPSAYGIADAESGCSLLPQCRTPERYVFWDNLHLTTSMHKAIAQISAEIVNPTNIK